MTALTAKAAWWVLKGWRGSPGSLRNDSFDGQSGHLSPGSLRNDSFDGQSCLEGVLKTVGGAVLDPLEMTALTAKAAWFP